MKMIFAILLMSVTSFAFAQKNPQMHDCDDPGMGGKDPECKKQREEAHKHCPNKPLWDSNNGGYIDYLGRHCGTGPYRDGSATVNPIYCIKTFDEKTKKDVYHYSCSKKP